MTLRVAVYGAPGYRQAGLFAAYERLHPGVRIVEDTTAQEPGYWQGLQRHLATGRGLDDLVAIPMTEMGNVLGRYSARLVPLTTLGGVAGGVNTLPGPVAGLGVAAGLPFRPGLRGRRGDRPARAVLPAQAAAGGRAAVEPGPARPRLVHLAGLPGIRAGVPAAHPQGASLP